jgi:hypothetical protein
VGYLLWGGMMCIYSIVVIIFFLHSLFQIINSLDNKIVSVANDGLFTTTRSLLLNVKPMKAQTQQIHSLRISFKFIPGLIFFFFFTYLWFYIIFLCFYLFISSFLLLFLLFFCTTRDNTMEVVFPQFMCSCGGHVFMRRQDYPSAISSREISELFLLLLFFAILFFIKRMRNTFCFWSSFFSLIYFCLFLYEE